MKCECCGKESESLTAKSAYNGNKDTNYYCNVCFKKVHKDD